MLSTTGGLRATNVCRSCLDASASTPGSMDIPVTFRSVSVWLHVTRVSQASRFAFLCLTDFYMLDLRSSASTSTSNEPVRTICVRVWWVARTTLVSRHFVFFDFDAYADYLHCPASSASLTRVESTLPPLVVSSMSPSRPSSPSLPSPVLSPLALAVTHSSALNASSPLLTCSKTKLQLAVSIGAFIGKYTSMSPSLTLLH